MTRTMSGIAAARPVDALRRAAIRATFAPSVHNTQPWRFVVADDRLSIYADRARQLPVLDPSGRQLTISLGAALFNARASLAADGLAVDVQRFPNRGRPDLVAVVTVTGHVPSDRESTAATTPLAALDRLVTVRSTNRRRFAEDEVPPGLVADLQNAAEVEGAGLLHIQAPDDRQVVATLSQHADAVENLNPAYRAEIRAWTSGVHRRDGVPQLVVPHVDGTAMDEVPIRDFDSGGHGYLPAATHSSARQCLVLLTSAGDAATDWLRAGEAFERILLEVARHGFAASPLTQVTEVPSARSQLRRELRLAGYPQMLLRVGRAPAVPATRRRRLVDVITEES